MEPSRSVELEFSGWSIAQICDRLADRFELAWRRGERPTIESFLGSAPLPAQEPLFAELLRVELELRRSAQEQPTPAEYEARFPAQSTLVAAAFGKDLAGTAASPASSQAGTTSEIDFSLISTSPVRNEEATDSQRAALATIPYLPLPPGAGQGECHTSGEPESGVSARSDGRFKVLRFHREGGLGQVSVALDIELTREVAFKEIKPKYAHEEQSQARFLLEAEITGGLEHPGIVPVYSLGKYEDGRPYYAMRFIRGESLRDTCDNFHERFKESRNHRAWNLELQKLLRRFLDICNAIDYAHSRGVLHRDLKPANVMLGRFGETLVVDWGLAKVLGTAECTGDGDEETTLRPPSHGSTDPTQYGNAMGTWAYMPPEQAAGQLELLSPASDVYSLGATLYHVLTGKPSIQRQNDDDDDLKMRVIQGLFPRPRKVEKRVTPALEAICLKAMARERSERYQSARELADDIEHYLADEPVTAYREPLRQRLSRLARRHKSWTQAAAVALVLVAGVSVVATLLVSRALRREEEQRAIADRNFEAAQKAVDDFYTTVSESTLLNVPGMQPLRRQLLEQAKEYYEGFIEQRSADASVQHGLGAAYQRAAIINAELGATSNAVTYYKRALEIYGHLVRENPNVSQYHSELAASLDNLGGLQSKQGRIDEALTSFERALEIQERLARENPDVSQYQRELATSRNNLGLLQMGQERNDEALASHQRALVIRERLARENPDLPEYQSNLARSHNNLGLLQMGQGQNDEALASFERAREIQERLVRENPDLPEYQSDLARSHHNLGGLKSDLGHHDEAIDSHHRALEIKERLARENSDIPEYQSELAASHNNLGLLLSDLGQADAALASYVRAREIQEWLARQDPGVIGHQSELAASHDNLGGLQMRLGRHDEALANFKRAREIRERLVHENPDVPQYQSDLAKSQYNLSFLQNELGRHDDALASYQRALEIQKKLARENPDVPRFRYELAGSHNDLSLLQNGLGHNDEALASYERALEIYESLVREDPDVPRFRYKLAGSHYNLGYLQMGLGRHDEALANFERAREIRERLVRENPDVPQYRSELATSHNKLGLLQMLQGRNEEALVGFERAREIREWLTRENPDLPEYQSNLAGSHNNLGLLQMGQERNDEALASFERAREIQERLARENPNVLMYQLDLAGSHNNLGKLQSGLGRIDKALTSYELALEIKERLARTTPAVPQFRSELAMSHYSIGVLQNKLGRNDAALASYEQAREIWEKLIGDNVAPPEIDQHLVAVHSVIAWLLATDSTETILNGERAVTLATKACELTEWQVGHYIDTLAAAYAESGGFDKAVEYEMKAIELATPDERPVLETRLELYKSGKPYREPFPAMDETTVQESIRDIQLNSAATDSREGSNDGRTADPFPSSPAPVDP